jgi:XTP/dITP diphosphohydrolase
MAFLLLHWACKNTKILTFAAKIDTMDERLQAFKRLLDIMDAVRAGCPWDSTQTIHSLRHLTIEETYELSQAILNDDLNEVKKELGDLMLHLVFYAKIGQEQGAFDIADVLNGICEKMIVRHPHIFGNEHVENAEQVEQNWEKIKLEREHNRSVLGGVPEGLPSLLKAYRMTQKTAGVGFRWPDADHAWQKVEEEKGELIEALKNPDNTAHIEEEYGDLLFALAAYGNYIGVNPDDALEKTNKKFRERFAYIEQKAREQGKGVQHLTLNEMINYWKESKAL